MKKFLLLIAVGMIALVGCKSEGNYPLENTVWKGNLEITASDTLAGTLTFYQTTFKLRAVGNMIIGGPIEELVEGTYIYEHPRVSTTVKGKTVVATIDGNKIYLGKYVLTRQ